MLIPIRPITEEKKALKCKRQNRYSLVSLQMFCSGGRRMELTVLARVVSTSAPGQKIFSVLFFPLERKLFQSNANRAGAPSVLDFSKWL